MSEAAANLLAVVIVLVWLALCLGLAGGFILLNRVVLVLKRERRWGGRYGYAIHNTRVRQAHRLEAAKREGIDLRDASELRVLALHDMRLVSLLKQRKAFEDAMLAISGKAPKKPSEEPYNSHHKFNMDTADTIITLSADGTVETLPNRIFVTKPDGSYEVMDRSQYFTYRHGVKSTQFGAFERTAKLIGEMDKRGRRRR